MLEIAVWVFIALLTVVILSNVLAGIYEAGLNSYFKRREQFEREVMRPLQEAAEARRNAEMLRMLQRLLHALAHPMHPQNGTPTTPKAAEAEQIS